MVFAFTPQYKMVWLWKLADVVVAVLVCGITYYFTANYELAVYIAVVTVAFAVALAGGPAGAVAGAVALAVTLACAGALAGAVADENSDSGLNYSIYHLSL